MQSLTPSDLDDIRRDKRATPWELAQRYGLTVSEVVAIQRMESR